MRLIRHSNREINVFEVFETDIDKFICYTAWQPEGRYAQCKYLAIFGPSQGTTAQFLGLYEVNGFTSNEDLKEHHKFSLEHYNLPPEWYEKSVYYHLKQSKVMKDLINRLVIEWGKGTVSWFQKKDKDIIQIKPVNSIFEFESYNQILIPYSKLKELF